jgi:hypothetical protein
MGPDAAIVFELPAPRRKKKKQRKAGGAEEAESVRREGDS